MELSELYTDDKISNYSSNATKETKSQKLPLMNYLVKLLTKRKFQINKFAIARQTFFSRNLQNL